MDSARALGIMGFSSTRWMDASTGMDPKEALDKALSDQMQSISQKKKQAVKERVKIKFSYSFLDWHKCNGIEMWTGPLASLSLSSVVVLDKDQDSRSGIGSLLFLFSWI